MPILLLLLLTSHIILLSHCNPDHLEPPSISLLSYSQTSPLTCDIHSSPHYYTLFLSSHNSHLLTISLVCVRFSFHPPPQSSLPIFVLLLRSHSHPLALQHGITFQIHTPPNNPLPSCFDKKTNTSAINIQISLAIEFPAA